MEPGALVDAATILGYAKELGPAVLLFVVFVAGADIGIAFLYRAAIGASGDGESFRD